MTENKRFWSEDYSVGYYTEIVDNEKKLEDVPNPKKNLTIEEVVDTLNELAEENNHLEEHLNIVRSHRDILISKNKELQERNNRQCKQLDDLFRLIEEKDWRALNDILDDFQLNGRGF